MLTREVKRAFPTTNLCGMSASPLSLVPSLPNCRMCVRYHRQARPQLQRLVIHEPHAQTSTHLQSYL